MNVSLIEIVYLSLLGEFFVKAFKFAFQLFVTKNISFAGQPLGLIVAGLLFYYVLLQYFIVRLRSITIYRIDIWKEKSVMSFSIYPHKYNTKSLEKLLESYYVHPV